MTARGRKTSGSHSPKLEKKRTKGVSSRKEKRVVEERAKEEGVSSSYEPSPYSAGPPPGPFVTPPALQEVTIRNPRFVSMSQVGRPGRPPSVLPQPRSGTIGQPVGGYPPFHPEFYYPHATRGLQAGGVVHHRPNMVTSPPYGLPYGVQPLRGPQTPYLPSSLVGGSYWGPTATPRPPMMPHLYPGYGGVPMYGPQGYWVNGPLPGLGIRHPGPGPSTDQASGTSTGRSGGKEQVSEPERPPCTEERPSAHINCADLTAGSPTVGESPPLHESPPSVLSREITLDSLLRGEPSTSEPVAPEQGQQEEEEVEGPPDPRPNRPYPWEGLSNIAEHRKYPANVIRPKARKL